MLSHKQSLVIKYYCDNCCNTDEQRVYNNTKEEYLTFTVGKTMWMIGWGGRCQRNAYGGESLCHKL